MHKHLNKYIEDIAFLVLKKYFSRSLRSLVKYFFQHLKRHFLSPSGHVKFFLLYKHQ